QTSLVWSALPFATLLNISTRAVVLSSCCCFFFSSRRRHTRFSRDWSSDVCSSDLLGCASSNEPRRVPNGPAGARGAHSAHLSSRSEERRVGKERRSRWSPDH